MTRTEITDEIMLAGHLLAAMESGRVPMHADDYLQIARWVSGELDRLASFELARFRLRLPGALQDIAENLLHQRAVLTPPTETPACIAVSSDCQDLMQRLRRVPRL